MLGIAGPSQVENYGRRNKGKIFFLDLIYRLDWRYRRAGVLNRRQANPVRLCDLVRSPASRLFVYAYLNLTE